MIINPFIIYLIYVADAMKVGIGLFILGCVGVILFNAIMRYDLSLYDDNFEELQTKYVKRIKVGTIVMFALVAFEIFIPDSKTLTIMYITKYVTVENVNASIEAIKSATDYVINAINSIK